MVRSAVSKVMWVGRATVFLVGLSVLVGLVFGVTSVAFGTDGQSFIVGQTNSATLKSILDKSGAGPALELQVDSGPALAVSSAAKVRKLNADRLDSLDSTEIGRELWAVVNSNGTLVRGNGVTSSQRSSTGTYQVTFNRDVDNCAAVATVDNGGTASVAAAKQTGAPNVVLVSTSSLAGGSVTAFDFPFELIVAC